MIDAQEFVARIALQQVRGLASEGNNDSLFTGKVLLEHRQGVSFQEKASGLSMRKLSLPRSTFSNWKLLPSR